MRFRGGGVGHLGTRYLDSRLKKDNIELGNEEQHDATGDDLCEDSDSDPHNEWSDGIEGDLAVQEARTRRAPGNDLEEDEDEVDNEDEDKGKGKDEGEGKDEDE